MSTGGSIPDLIVFRWLLLKIDTHYVHNSMLHDNILFSIQVIVNITRTKDRRT